MLQPVLSLAILFTLMESLFLHIYIYKRAFSFSLLASLRVVLLPLRFSVSLVVARVYENLLLLSFCTTVQSSCLFRVRVLSLLFLEPGVVARIRPSRGYSTSPILELSGACFLSSVLFNPPPPPPPLRPRRKAKPPSHSSFLLARKLWVCMAVL